MRPKQQKDQEFVRPAGASTKTIASVARWFVRGFSDAAASCVGPICLFFVLASIACLLLLVLESESHECLVLPDALHPHHTPLPTHSLLNIPSLCAFTSLFIFFLQPATQFVLYESASGYSLMEVVEAEEIASAKAEVLASMTDLARFSKIVKLKAFQVGCFLALVCEGGR